MKIKCVSLILLVFFLITCLSSTVAQYHNSKIDSIYSVHLHENRNIGIHVPIKLDKNKENSFDVLYVLDGEWASSLSKTVYEFLEYAKFIPSNLIIVSVPNKYISGVNMRRRDFTPTNDDPNAISGEADKFLCFLEEELIPYINSRYKTNVHNNSLYGSSLGGLFSIYALLQGSNSFKSYLTIEPALRWDKQYINRNATVLLNKNLNSDTNLWIAARDGKDFEDMGIANFESLLEEMNLQKLNYKVQTYSNETHFSVIWKGLYDGLKFIFS